MHRLLRYSRVDLARPLLDPNRHDPVHGCSRCGGTMLRPRCSVKSYCDLWIGAQRGGLRAWRAAVPHSYQKNWRMRRRAGAPAHRSPIPDVGLNVQRRKVRSQGCERYAKRDGARRPSGSRTCRKQPQHPPPHPACQSGRSSSRYSGWGARSQRNWRRSHVDMPQMRLRCIMRSRSNWLWHCMRRGGFRLAKRESWRTYR